MHVTCQRHTAFQTREDAPSGLAFTLALRADAAPAAFGEEEYPDGLLAVPKYSTAELMKLQREDPVINRIIHLLESGETLPASHSESYNLRLTLKEWKRPEVKDGSCTGIDNVITTLLVRYSSQKH